MSDLKKCVLCKIEGLEGILQFKSQPLCNRFLTDPLNPAENEYVHDMNVMHCNSCGLIQLNDLVPAKELHPKYNWITYKEAEEHLDKLAQEMSKLPDLNKDSRILGVSFKDDTLLKRMSGLGFNNIYRIDAKADLGAVKSDANVDTIQDKLGPVKAREITCKYGKADLIILRHILEHAYDVDKFTNALRELVNPNGHVVIEIPECSLSLDALDYTTLWEEHTMYFTPDTFKHYCSLNNLSLKYFEIFPYKLENSLACIAQFKQDMNTFLDKNALLKEQSRAYKFGKEFSREKERIRQFMSDFSASKGKIAMFGAGHLGCTFINLFEIKDYLSCVIDDNPNKQGLYMPGSKLPIYKSDVLPQSDGLLKDKIKLCLLAMNIEGENKIIERNKEFVNKGGIFGSIFKLSKNYFENI